jgi:hypothetical protein
MEKSKMEESRTFRAPKGTAIMAFFDENGFALELRDAKNHELKLDEGIELRDLRLTRLCCCQNVGGTLKCCTMYCP